ncbi:4-(cytidine 5'-diphospho)-2-C-methyl-D-erythritol kinase [Ochrobactrum sp. CM-21-5]|nr:4-(cytidine 5'-diphospho)-2-C-methyl-D-erythritol kinase [Ochrobactrum sp. CM-21-5]MBC2884536.1 4-(cytidine 5'-diphospho)-2-C-methyl-D-erythritol kinase [Ochrobactrum sp. CM-21-5]
MTDFPTAPQSALHCAREAVERLAPAKINLALHVIGRRDDGYHLLDMLVVFARHGDTIRVESSASDRFTASGPFATGIPLDNGNLVLKARDALRHQTQHDLPPVAIHLEKRLPVASGIGGGSSDAAATLLALNTFWNLDLDLDTLKGIGLKLGADLPMCLHGAALGTPLLAHGIGEDLAQATGLPALPMLLINDGTAVSTPDVFRALTERDNPPLAHPSGGNLDTLCSYLRTTRNDLLPAALSLAPQIGDKLERLRGCGALYTQMSGSGATCFAIFADQVAAETAATEIAVQKPGWFVVATSTVASHG